MTASTGTQPQPAVAADATAVPEPQSDPGRRIGARLRGAWARIPGRWRFVVGLFLTAKIVMTLAAMLAVYAFDSVFRMLPDGVRQAYFDYQSGLSSHRSISMWLPWDSVHYGRLVSRPITGPNADLIGQFCFPPLYPLLGKAVLPVVAGHAAWALLLVSNAAFLLLLYYGYRLAEKLWGDEADARRFTRYLVLLPTAFIFQAGLTEPVFLCLVLASFYYAESRKWLVAGILGGFAALTRSTGFLLVIPLAVVLLQQGGYRLHLKALWGYLKAGWPLVLVPSGWLLFMVYSKLRTGDWQRYQHLQESQWGISLQNPLRFLFTNLLDNPHPDNRTRLWIALACLVLAVVAFWYLRPAYPVYAIIFILMPLAIGEPGYRSLLRYLLVVFPLALLCARWARRPNLDVYLTAGLALVQGVLLVAWANVWTGFII